MLTIGELVLSTPILFSLYSVVVGRLPCRETWQETEHTEHSFAYLRGFPRRLHTDVPAPLHADARGP
jgi:hypothetical protein